MSSDVVERLGNAILTSAEDAHDDRLRIGTRQGAVASPNLTIDNRRSNRLTTSQLNIELAMNEGTRNLGLVSGIEGWFSKLEKDSMTLVDRISDPSLSGITAIKNRLKELDCEQQKLKSKITDLTLQIRDRRDLDISTEEVQTAYEDFVGLSSELDFDERQYALRLLIKQIVLSFKKGEKGRPNKNRGMGTKPHASKNLPGKTQIRKVA